MWFLITEFRSSMQATSALKSLTHLSHFLNLDSKSQKSIAIEISLLTMPFPWCPCLFHAPFWFPARICCHYFTDPSRAATIYTLAFLQEWQHPAPCFVTDTVSGQPSGLPLLTVCVMWIMATRGQRIAFRGKRFFPGPVSLSVVHAS